MAGAFIGHTHVVLSVAFSADGQHVVSGSSDQTVHVWNISTGETAAGPFTEQMDLVNLEPVVFLPDGQ